MDAVNLNAIFIFSERDNHYADDLKAYLRPSHLDFLRTIDFFSVEELNEGSFDELLERTELIFLLLSMDTLSNPLLTSKSFYRAVRDHQLKRILIVPILLRHCILENKGLSGIQIYPLSANPILSKYWLSKDEAYVAAVKELLPHCRNFRNYKESVMFSWNEAISSDEVAKYDAFLAKYPQSRLAAEAGSRRNSLLEKKLWEEAEKRNEVKSYHYYLLNSPLQLYRFEAAARIFDLEGSREDQWQETRNSNNLQLFLQYKNRFPYDANMEQLDPLIDRKLEDYKMIERINNKKLKSSYLDIQAYKKLNESGIVAYQSYSGYALSLRRKALGIFSKLSDGQYFPAFFILVLAFLNYFLIYYFDLFNSESEFSGGPSPIGVLILVFLNLFLLWESYLWWNAVRTDLEVVQKTVDSLKALSVLLRVAVISNDMLSIQNILKFARLLENKIEEVGKRTLLEYFFGMASTGDAPSLSSFDKLDRRHAVGVDQAW